MPRMTIDMKSISGEAAYGYVQERRQGSVRALWFEPMPAWMTEVPVGWAAPGHASNAEVYLQTNNGDVLKAVCDGSGEQGAGFYGMASGSEQDCSFVYAVNSTPVVTNYTMAYLGKQVGRVRINGHGFALGGTNNTVLVKIAGQLCTVVEKTDTWIACNISSVPWGYYPVSVNVVGYGEALRAINKTLYFNQLIYSISPSSGSFAGGQLITIVGRGFRNTASVKIGGRSCIINSITSSQITCQTPAAMMLNTSRGAMTSQFEFVTVDGFKALSKYKYDESLTPIVTSHNPQNISSAITTTLVIYGHRLGTNTTITVGGAHCALISSSDRNITCYLARSTTASIVSEFDVQIYVPNYGFAGTLQNVNILPVVTRGFEVFSVSPSTGSLMGGSNLLVKGFGFLPNSPARHNISLSKTSVQIDSYNQLLIYLGYYVGYNFTEYCNVTSVSFFELLCSVPHAYYGVVDSSFTITVTLNSLASVSASGSNSTFFQLRSHTPSLDKSMITSISSSGSVSLIINGTNLLAGDLTIWAGSVECSSHATSNTTATAVCPDMIAGKYFLLGYVQGLGYSAGFASFAFNVSISSVASASAIGSAAGGTALYLVGYGFSPYCSNNSIKLTFTGLATTVSATEFIYCTNTKIKVLSPSLVSLLGTWSSSTSKSLSSVSVTVGSTSAKVTVNSILTVGRATTPVSSTNIGSGYSSTVVTASVSTSSSGFNVSSSYVLIGSTPCQRSTITSSTSYAASWNCIVPPLGAGTYSVRVNMWPFGYAVLSTGLFPSFVSLLKVNKMHSYLSSSVGGGAILSLTGFGLSNTTVVTICGQPCLGSANYNGINCSVPAITTAASVTHFESMNVTRDLINILNGSIFSSADQSAGNQIAVGKAFDSNYGTYFQDHRVGCFIGLLMPSGNVSRPFRVRFYPRVQYSSYFHGAVFEGSTDGGRTYHVIGYTQSAHEGWNYINTLENYTSSWFNSYRFRSTDPMYSSSYCFISEIQFLGVMAVQNSTCAVRVAQSTAVLYVGNVSYDHYSYTPIVTSLSPSNGSSLGGTPVTIHGQNFLSPMKETPHVSISGITCKVLSFNSSQITCVTRPREPDLVVPSFLTVFVPGLGYSISADSAVYLYIDRWSALTTWRNQEPPIAGDLVWVPEGQVIMWDVNTPVLSALLIEGALYVDTEKDVTLDAYYIFVKGGIMQVGTHDHPYEHHATITLHGDR